ncbi:hypothetical protein CEXT_572751 [Caerostris extrusa]|uniref:Uncharacterized protein n=1 Tax=Caerostris extrusa TaxID=172846 RepID=A0AAV4PRK0_CAEEX|nr:hypothetical protein CEXT_572751 [Caerostris extrusa]
MVLDSVRKIENSFVTVSVKGMRSDTVIRNCILRWLPGFLRRPVGCQRAVGAAAKASEYVSSEKYSIAGPHMHKRNLSLRKLLFIRSEKYEVMECLLWL